ncbi:MAG: hypothetical protein ABJB01_13585 [Rudaea sp.]
MKVWLVRGTAVCLVTLFFAGVAAAQSLNNSPIIFSSGVWDVHRTTDAMTDATVCTSIYKNQFGIQLGENMLTIAIADGVKNVQLRFDEAAAKPLRLATKSEFQNNRIEVTASDFAELIDSRRLRYQVTTGTNDTASGDIDLNGVFQTHDNVRAGCAGNPIAAPEHSAAMVDTCTPGLRDRMSRKGIAPQDIQDICSAQASE